MSSSFRFVVVLQEHVGPTIRSNKPPEKLIQHVGGEGVQGGSSNGSGSAVVQVFNPQNTQSAGPVRFLIFCSISIILLARLIAGRKPQCTAGAD
jgi:hypothetical protein